MYNNKLWFLPLKLGQGVGELCLPLQLTVMPFLMFLLRLSLNIFLSLTVGNSGTGRQDSWYLKRPQPRTGNLAYAFINNVVKPYVMEEEMGHRKMVILCWRMVWLHNTWIVVYLSVSYISLETSWFPTTGINGQTLCPISITASTELHGFLLYIRTNLHRHDCSLVTGLTDWKRASRLKSILCS